MRTFEFYSTNYSTIIQADTLHLAIKEFMRRYPNDEILQIEDVDSRESKSAVPKELVELKQNEYRCKMCLNVYEKEWSDEEALNESK